jgi:hypothetical protein
METLLSHLRGRNRFLQAPLRLACFRTDKRDHYATLSHRWGDSTPFHTTKDTIASYAELIRFSQLPKTFQDAVVVARSLGIRYLWIDALCIVQDDLHDWYNESRNMARVYQNALVNIAAHGSQNDRDGFLRRNRRPKIFLKVSKRKQNILRDFEEVVENSTLSSRGWVFQERILSQKIIHFTTKGNFWEDAYGIQAEDGRHTDCAGIRFIWRKYSLPHDWYRLMETSTALNLTYQKDRLAAIAGLATHFQNGAAAQSFARGAVQYCAGLWSNSVCHGLLWRIYKEPGDCLMRNSELNLPSWTWGCYLGAVWYPEELSELSPAATFQTFDSRSVFPSNSGSDIPSNSVLLSLNAYVKPMKELRWVSKMHDDIPSCENLFFRSKELWKVYYREIFIGWVALDNDYTNFSELWCACVATKWPKYDANPLRSCAVCKRDGGHYTFHTESIAFISRRALIVK